MASNKDILLAVKGLKVHFPIEEGAIFRKVIGLIRAVDGIDFEIMRGETLGLVGESGCGKSTTARAIAQLYEPTAGEIYFEGRDLCKLSKADLLEARMSLQMIFQDPYASLNPRMTIGEIIAEPLEIYTGRKFLDLSTSDIRKRVEDLLGKVGLSRYFVNRFPHEFSGGQKQRIGIARALALNPKLILADEPVSALDVSIQSQILNLLRDLQDELRLAYLFIAHDLAIIRHISNRVAVMYLGVIVEIAESAMFYGDPLHPYTRGLLKSMPRLDDRRKAGSRLDEIPGVVPSLNALPEGCIFSPRCDQVKERCRKEPPPLRYFPDNKSVRCWLYAA